MKTIATKLGTTALASSMMILAACGGGDGPNGLLPADGPGFLSLAVSDSPVQSARKVCVAFDSIEVKRVGDAPITFDFPTVENINLLDYQGANAAPLLTREELSAGFYEWVRLGVNAMRGGNGGVGDTGDDCVGDESYIVMDDGMAYNLFVPSGEQAGLRLVAGFTVPANGSIDATAEWDLVKAVTAPPGLSPDVILRPTIRLVNNVEAGTLSGVVSNELVEAAECEPSVFLFNDGITPNPIEDEVEDELDPVATAIVQQQTNNDGSTSYFYEIGFLLADDYEAAFTCDGATFAPEEGKDASITARQTTTVDFP